MQASSARNQLASGFVFTLPPFAFKLRGLHRSHFVGPRPPGGPCTQLQCLALCRQRWRGEQSRAIPLSHFAVQGLACERQDIKSRCVVIQRRCGGVSPGTFYRCLPPPPPPPPLPIKPLATPLLLQNIGLQHARTCSVRGGRRACTAGDPPAAGSGAMGGLPAANPRRGYDRSGVW